jgi:hypothetical protein
LALPTGAFWTANILAAVLFGLGHLPATAALAPLSAALVVRAIVLNGTGGVVFGELYRRYGLEWAMTPLINAGTACPPSRNEPLPGQRRVGFAYLSKRRSSS